MPQAILLNHASWVTRKNSELKFEAKREYDKKASKGIIVTAEEKAEAAFVEELDPKALSRYMSQVGQGF